MRSDLENLSSDPVFPHRLVRDMAAVVELRNGEIERLQLIIRQLQRAQYGRRSKRLDPDRLALGLEDVETDLAQPVTGQEPNAKPRTGSPGASRCPIICHASSCG